LNYILRYPSVCKRSYLRTNMATERRLLWLLYEAKTVQKAIITHTLLYINRKWNDVTVLCLLSLPAMLHFQWHHVHRFPSLRCSTTLLLHYCLSWLFPNNSFTHSWSCFDSAAISTFSWALIKAAMIYRPIVLNLRAAPLSLSSCSSNAQLTTLSIAKII